MFYRKLLLWIHAAQFVAFFSLSIFTFALPSLRSRIEDNGKNFDLFYKIIFVGSLNYISDNYTSFGFFFFFLAFIALLTFLGIHGMYKFGIYLSTLFSIFIIVFFPLGTIISPYSLYIIFNLNKEFEETEKLVRHQKLSRISIKKIRPKTKFIDEIKNDISNTEKAEEEKPSKKKELTKSKPEIQKLNTNLSKKKSS